MACCAVRLDQPALHPVLELMPAVILSRRAASDDATLRVLLNAMADEVIAERMGAATILARLADVVIARLIRSWAEGQLAPTGWLAALRDKHVRRVLAAIHREPGHSWSLTELAAKAGLSRSVFCQRFAELAGQSPARYVVRWRMHLAGRWLQTDGLSVAEVAGRLGYGSEAAFSRAFKRVVGDSPGELRRLRKNSRGDQQVGIDPPHRRGPPETL
jgi:AraC-like DNA-binding protein